MKKIIKLISLLSICVLSINSSMAASAKIGPCQEQVCKDYFKQYKKYSKLGYADAMVTFAEMYYYGYGTKKSIKKALKQYRSAAKWGSVKGQYKTGIMYLNEEEVKDVENGVKYLKKAARKGHVNAAMLLGIIFFSEEHFEQDLSEADKWLTRAYQKKHPKMSSFLNYMKSTKHFNENNFPDLTAEIAENPLPVEATPVNTNEEIVKSTSSKVKSPENIAKKDKVEVITVYGSLPDRFDAQIASLRNTYPEKHAENTGSKIIGKNCAQTLSCGMTSDEDFVRLADHFAGHHAVLKFKSEGIGW